MNVNQPVADTRLYVEKPRLFPNYPAVNLRTNGAGHQYHAMTVEAERRLQKGISYQASWTWAKDIEDLNGFLFASPENAYDRRRERGNSLDTPRHRVTFNTVFQLPFGEGKKFFGNAGKGLNVIVLDIQLLFGSVPDSDLERSRSDRHGVHFKPDTAHDHFAAGYAARFKPAAGSAYPQQMVRPHSVCSATTRKFWNFGEGRHRWTRQCGL